MDEEGNPYIWALVSQEQAKPDMVDIGCWNIYNIFPPNVMSLELDFNGAAPCMKEYVGNVTLTNPGSNYVIANLPVTSGHTGVVNCNLTCYCTAGTDAGNSFIQNLVAGYSNTSGTITINTITNSYHNFNGSFSGSPSPGATLTSSGGNAVLLSILSPTTDTMNWSFSYKSIIN